MILGKNGKWMWLTSKAACLGDVVERCPQLVIDRFVLITSHDSGLIVLDDQQLKDGWKYLGEVANNPELVSDFKREGAFALSPRISATSILPVDVYDEWYVFAKPPQFETAEVFINWGAFSLSFGHTGRHELAPHGFEGRFWDQLLVLNPLSYIADNGYGTLLFTTADALLYEQMLLAIQDIELEVSTACDAKSPMDLGDCPS